MSHLAWTVPTYLTWQQWKCSFVRQAWPHICHFSPQLYFLGSIFLHMKARKLWQNLPKFPKISQKFPKFSQNFSTWQFFLHKYNLWYLWQIWALKKSNLMFRLNYPSVYVVIIHPHIFSGETMAVDTKPSAKCISRVNTGGGQFSGPGFVSFSQKILVFIGPESDHWLCLSLTDWLTH